MIENLSHFQVVLGVMWRWLLVKTGGCAARDPLDASVGDRTSHETHKFLEGKDAVRCNKARKNKLHQYI